MPRVQFRELRSGIVDQKQHARIATAVILREHGFGAGREADRAGQPGDFRLAYGFRCSAQRHRPQRVALRRIHQIFLGQILANRRQRRLIRARRNKRRQLL